MTNTFKSLIVHEDIPEIRRRLQKYATRNTVMFMAIFLSCAMLTWFVFMTLYRWTPELGDAIKEDKVSHASLIVANAVCLIIAIISFLHVLSCATVTTVLRDISSHGYANGTDYTLLKAFYGTDREPRDGTQRADQQELLLALWLCMFEDYDITVEPGCLPQGKTTFTARQGERQYVETFMLPVNGNVLAYGTDENKTKHVALRKRG